MAVCMKDDAMRWGCLGMRLNGKCLKKMSSTENTVPLSLAWQEFANKTIKQAKLTVTNSTLQFNKS